MPKSMLYIEINLQTCELFDFFKVFSQFFLSTMARKLNTNKLLEIIW